MNTELDIKDSTGAEEVYVYTHQNMASSPEPQCTPIDVKQPLQPLRERCNRLQHTGLEPGCIGIKIRVISQSKTRMKNPVFMRVFSYPKSVRKMGCLILFPFLQKPWRPQTSYCNAYFRLLKLKRLLFLRLSQDRYIAIDRTIKIQFPEISESFEKLEWKNVVLLQFDFQLYLKIRMIHYICLRGKLVIQNE